ncbi:hypothetical protein HYV71_03975 [Candidatus Uhrbacteria bacterium]|nr:hypothetical protein [Candidatus Uhrbacteria bacterium]
MKHPDKKFFIRELTRKIDTQINSVRRELKNLMECGIIEEVIEPPHSDEIKGGGSTSDNASKTKKNQTKKSDGNLRKYFRANQSFLLHEEISRLFNKSPLLLQSRFLKEISGYGTVDYAILTGFFVGRSDSPVDMLIVGDIEKNRMHKLISGVEKEIDQEINYSIMKKSEFLYRKSITDRFLFTLLEGKKLILIDRLS